MADLVTDPDDPRLGHGVDTEPIPQHSAYLVLSEEERAKGFVRPLRRGYVHVGPPGPKYPLRELTEEEKARSSRLYVKYEEYPENDANTLGRYLTQEQLDKVDNGFGTLTTMSLVLCETYARDPHFYGATYCCGCQMHLPVNEFVWDEDGERVGS